jgi:hypothetical protein
MASPYIPLLYNFLEIVVLSFRNIKICIHPRIICPKGACVIGFYYGLAFRCFGHLRALFLE